MLVEKVVREKRSFRGYPYWVLEDRYVPRIHDSFLDCVLYLYKSREQAAKGERTGGTGFLVGMQSERHTDRVFLYAVTNRHVVQRGSLFIRLNTKTGLTDILETAITHWHFTDDQDIAVCPLALAPSHHKFKCVPANKFLTKETVLKENIGPGDDIFLVGRFMNHEGRQCNTPTVRFGNLSMMPLEPVGHASNQTRAQESFLGDVRAIAGYSGSPVFILPRLLDTSGGATVFTIRSPDPWLLGVEWGYLNQDDPEWGPVGGGVKENSGMTAIVPAWCLLELLCSAALTSVRKAVEDRLDEEQAKLGTSLT
jgi:hypothetical protein